MTGARMPRVVVITGASDGIGAEMARQLAAREGAGVALVRRSWKRSQANVRRLVPR
jgi:NAD(P)-dependent dehydrogenase (short-subunit alcohol dehydrogenase family)